MVSLLDDSQDNQVLSLLGNLVSLGRIGPPALQRQGPTESGDPLSPVMSRLQTQSSIDALASAGAAILGASGPTYGPPTPLMSAIAQGLNAGRSSAIGDEVAAQAAIDAQLRRRIMLRQEMQAEQANAILMQALPGLLGGGGPPGAVPAGPPPGYTPGASLRGLLGAAEGGDRGYGAVNAGGYSGKYQVGSQLLADMGVYTPASPEEDLRSNPWTGSFAIPGFPTVKTRDDFLRTPAAQDAVFEQAMSHVSKQLTDNGAFDRGIGQTINGVPVTREGLLAGAWLGGANGVKRWVDSGGKEDPADANGTRVSQYVALGNRAAAPAATPGTPATPAPTQVAAITPTTATDATPAPASAAGPAAAAGGGAVAALPPGAAPVMPTSLPYMAQSVVQQLPPAQRALVVAGLLNPKTSGATLIALATKQPQMPMQIDTGAGTYLLSPNGQITQVGGPKGAPTTQDFVVQGGDGTQQLRRHEFDPVTRQWIDRGPAPQSEQTQAFQVGGTNVIRHKDQAGNWTTVGLAPIPEGSQPLSEERLRQEIAKLTATGINVQTGTNPNSGKPEQYFLDPNTHQVHWLGVAPVPTPAQTQIEGAGQESFQRERGQRAAIRGSDYEKQASEAQQALDSLTTMRRLQQDVPTGPLAPHLTAAGALASQLHIDFSPISASMGPAAVAGAQTFSKLSAGLATHLIGANGFPSNSFSNADRQFVEGMVPNLTNVPNANLIVGAFMEAQARRVQQRAAEYAQLDKGGKDPAGTIEKWEADWQKRNNASPVFREVDTVADGNKLPVGTVWHVKGQPIDKGWGLGG